MVKCQPNRGTCAKPERKRQWAELIEVEQQAEELVAVEWAEEKGECGKGGSVWMFRGS